MSGARRAALLVAPPPCGSAAAIVFAAAERGETRHFRLVAAAARRRRRPGRRRHPPALSRISQVPYHSRWRHFSAGGVDRAALVAPGADPAEAGAGAARSGDRLGAARRRRRPAAGAFREAETGQVIGALRGARGRQPARDAGRPVLGRPAAIRGGPMPRRCGADARPARPAFSTPRKRARRARRAGRRCCAGSARSRPAARTCSARRRGSAISTITGRRAATALPAPDMLHRCCDAFGPIWPGRLSLAGVPLGDCGRHSAVPGRRPRAVPQAQPMAGLFAGRAAGARPASASPTSTG